MFASIDMQSKGEMFHIYKKKKCWLSNNPSIFNYLSIKIIGHELEKKVNFIF